MNHAKISKKVGLIGAGNMGSAIVEGLLTRKKILPRNVFVFDKDRVRLEDFLRRHPVQSVPSNADLVRQAEILLLAVKPQDLSVTLQEFQKELKPSHILISILAGTPLEKIRKLAGESPALVRAMPNLAAKVGASLTALAGKNAEAVGFADQIFSCCGKTLMIAEAHFDLITALSGSGPAYFFYLMEILSAAGVRHGLSKEQAEMLAVQTALGAGRLAQELAESPEVLREKVTSKGGTTEAALRVLKERNCFDIFQQALDAALERGKQLSRL